jgi:outer membrane protein OmpA-like peptidoglycan-associated protein
MKKFYFFFVSFIINSFLLSGQEIPKSINPQTSLDQAYKRSFNDALHFMKLTDYTTAIPILEELYEIFPNEPVFQYNLVQCYIANNEHISAIPILENLIKKYPNTEELYLWLAQSYHFCYNFDEAINQYNYFIKHFAKSKKISEARNGLSNSLNAKEILKTPKALQIINIGRPINTIFMEYAPVITEENNTLYFTFRGDSTAFTNDNSGLLSNPNKEYFEDIYVSYKNNDSSWQIPKRLNEPFNSKQIEHHDASVSISSNQQLMFIYKNKNNKESGNLILIKKNNNHWESFNELSEINSSYWEGSATITPDEKYIYFSSDRPGTLGDKDLWRATKQPDGSYGSIINLGVKINTSLAEDAPFVSNDGKYLYFSSQGHNSIGGYDLFYCEIKPDGSLDNVKNLGYPINSFGDDIYFSTNQKGDVAYFASNRPGGFGQLDIYYFKTDKKEITTYLYTLTGTVKWNNKPTACLLKVLNEKGEIENTYPISMHDGNYKLMLTGGTSYKLIFTENGFEDYIYELNLKDLKNNQQKVLDVTLTPIPQALAKLEEKVKEHEQKILLAQNEEKALKETLPNSSSNNEKEIRIELSRVFFDFDQTQIKAEFFNDLNNLARQLKNNPSLKLIIIGHADSKGSDEYNLKLSKRRANAVANYLVVRGVARKRMQLVAKGETEPLVPNENSDGSDSPQGRAKNRRVEFQIIDASNSNKLKIIPKNNWP